MTRFFISLINLGFLFYSFDVQAQVGPSATSALLGNTHEEEKQPAYDTDRDFFKFGSSNAKTVKKIENKQLIPDNKTGSNSPEISKVFKLEGNINWESYQQELEYYCNDNIQKIYDYNTFDKDLAEQVNKIYSFSKFKQTAKIEKDIDQIREIQKKRNKNKCEEIAINEFNKQKSLYKEQVAIKNKKIIEEQEEQAERNKRQNIAQAERRNIENKNNSETVIKVNHSESKNNSNTHNSEFTNIAIDENLDPLLYIKELRKCIEIGASEFNKREAEEFVIDYKKYLLAEKGNNEKDINNRVKEEYKKIITVETLLRLGAKPTSPDLQVVCISIEKIFTNSIKSFYASRGGKKKEQNNIALSDIIKIHKTNILKFNEMYKDTELEILDGSIVFNKITFTNRTYYGNPAIFGLRYWYDSFNECISDTNPAAGNNINVCRRENIVNITNIAMIQQKNKIKIICQNSEMYQSQEDIELNMDILKNLIPGNQVFLKKIKN